MDKGQVKTVNFWRWEKDNGESMGRVGLFKFEGLKC